MLSIEPQAGVAPIVQVIQQSRHERRRPIIMEYRDGGRMNGTAVLRGVHLRKTPARALHPRHECRGFPRNWMSEWPEDLRVRELPFDN